MSINALKQFSKELGFTDAYDSPGRTADSPRGFTGEEGEQEVFTDREKELLAKGEALPETLSPTQQKKEEEEQKDEGGFWSDIAWAVPRGVRDAAQGILSGVDAAGEAVFGKDTFIPDQWHKSDWMLGKPKTMTGNITSGIFQFATGFIPAFKVASMLGKTKKVSKLVDASKLKKIEKVKDKARKNKISQEKAIKQMRAIKGKTYNIEKGIIAGAVADFGVFKGDQERLADLLDGNVGLFNPVMKMMKYEGNEDDPEYLGRFKNVAEGLVLEGVFGGALHVAMLGLKRMRGGDNAITELTPEEELLIKEIEEPFSSTKDAPKVKDPKADGVDVGDDAIPSSETIIGTEEQAYIERARELDISLIDADGTKKTPGKLKLEVDRTILDKAYRDSPATARQIVVHHGGRLKDPDRQGGILFTTKSKEEAQDFARANQGFDEFTIEVPTNDYLIDPDTIAKEADGLKVLKELGVSKPKGKKLNDLLDVESDAYVGDKTRDAFLKSMKEKKFKGVETGAGAKDPRDTIALFETPKNTVKEGAEINARTFKQKVTQILGKSKGRGGDISLDSSTMKELISGVGDTASFWDIIRIVSKNITAESPIITKVDKKKQQEIVQFINDNPEKYDNLKEILENSTDEKLIQSANEELVMSTVIYKFMRHTAEETVGFARRHIDNPKSETDILNFVDSFARFTELSRINSLRGSIASGALMQRKFLKQGMDGLDNNTIRSLESPLDSSEYLDALAERLGTEGVSELAVRLSKISNFDEFEELLSLKKMQDVGQQTLGRKMLGMTREFYYNSLLSAFSTFEVNLGGGLITSALHTLERISGNLLTGNFNAAKNVLRHHYGTKTWKQGFSAMSKAWKNDRSVLVPGKTQFMEQRPRQRAFSTENNGVAGQAFNFLGAFINIPSRALVATDEFFKQMAYTGYIKGELAVRYLDEYKAALDAMDMKKFKDLGIDKDPMDIKDPEFTNWLNAKVETEFEKHLTSDGSFYSEKNRLMAAHTELTRQGKLFGEGREEALDKYLKENPSPKDTGTAKLAETAQQISNELTFTNDNHSWFESLEKLIRSAPFGMGYASSFLIPFFRTPVNILTYALKRTPIGLVAEGAPMLTRKLLKKNTDTLKKGSAADKALVRGRLATGATMMYVWHDVIYNRQDSVTGGGPQSKQEREALRATGWQPYSIKYGDTYYSYQRLDPISTMIGLAADIRDHQKFDQSMDEATMQSLGANMAFVFAENLTDKTFLQGVNNAIKLMDDPEYYGPKLGRDIAAGFVPNIINHFKNTETEIMVREVRSLQDAVFKRLPGLEGTLAPRRTVLGEAAYRENPGGAFWSALNPIYTSKVKNDKVLSEMASLEHGFSMPSKNFYGIPEIDMTQIPIEGKYDAYDRYLELSGTVKLGGKTLKQRLKSLMGTDFYNRLPETIDFEETGQKSPRIKAINKVINNYRKRARYELLQESPQLKEMFDQAMQARREGSMPQS
tara:strand:+ start:2751 stop:7178 length:4428 start_codon:yes stop_codon:yes gene_type:complete